MKLTYKVGNSQVRGRYPLAARRTKVVGRHARWGLLMLGAGALVFAALPGLSNGSVRPAVATSHAKKIKPDFAYFNGKTVNVILEVAVGGSPELVETTQLAGQYLHATFNVSYNANNVPAVDQTFSSAPDGLTLGMGAITSLMTKLIYYGDPYSVPIKNLQYIFGSEGAPTVLAACPGSGITSIKQLMSGNQSYVGMATPGAPVDLELTAFGDVFGHVSNILTGFTSATLSQGCLAGDGGLSMIADTQILNSAGTGLVPGYVPLAQTGPQPAGGPLTFLNKEIPTFAQLGQEYPPKSKAAKAFLKGVIASTSSADPSRFLAAPANTPPQYVAALRDAFAWAFKQPAAKALFLYNNTPDHPSAGAQMLSYVDLFLKRYLPLFREYATAPIAKIGG